MTNITFILLFLSTTLVLYFLVIRPMTLTWGATQEEATRSLTGDNVVQKTHFVATRAVTIDAAPAEVWKWIVQIGSARAGWYSLDWVDNAGVESSRRILPEFQRIAKDDFAPFTPDQKNGMWVKCYDEHKHILWWDKKGNATWLWQLDEIQSGKTRLITRLRTKYDFTFPWIIYYTLYDIGDIVMMSKCMLGIKERAEQLA
jgi:hypothetical protein